MQLAMSKNRGAVRESGVGSGEPLDGRSALSQKMKTLQSEWSGECQ